MIRLNFKTWHNLEHYFKQKFVPWLHEKSYPFEPNKFVLGGPDENQPAPDIHQSLDITTKNYIILVHYFTIYVA